MCGCDEAALGAIHNAEHKSAIGSKVRDVSRRRWIASQDGAVVFRQRKTAGRFVRQVTIEIRKDSWRHGHHDDSIKLPIPWRTAPANTEKRFVSHPRLQSRADIGSGIPVDLGPEIIAIGNRELARNWENCGRNHRLSVPIDYQNSIDSGGRFLDLAQL